MMTTSSSVKRALTPAALLLCGVLPALAGGDTAGSLSMPRITVREDGGTYLVAARFAVPQAPDVVLDVLTDYEDIPRFLPDIKRSIVLRREPGRAIVEQEAVSGMLMVSRRIHLVLEVEESSGGIRFRDASGRSFSRYEGSWGLCETPEGTLVTYELTADPSFTVPQFLLKRVLRRDAEDMIDRLRAEFEARSPAPSRLEPGAPDTRR